MSGSDGCTMERQAHEWQRRLTTLRKVWQAISTDNVSDYATLKKEDALNEEDHSFCTLERRPSIANTWVLLTIDCVSKAPASGCQGMICMPSLCTLECIPSIASTWVLLPASSTHPTGPTAAIPLQPSPSQAPLMSKHVNYWHAHTTHTIRSPEIRKFFAHLIPPAAPACSRTVQPST